MDQALIFWPMLAHVLLVFIVHLELGRRRMRANKNKETKIGNYRVLNDQTEPAYCAVVARNVVNNYEAPTLFHIACLGLFTLNAINGFVLAVACVIVGLRYAHAYVHITYNNVLHRGFCFIGSFVLTLLLWAMIALALLGR